MAARRHRPLLEVHHAQFVDGAIDAVELGDLADGLRRAHDAAVAGAVRPSLPDVADLAKAWPTLTIEQRRLVLVAATAELTIAPTTHKPFFDASRIVWVPVA